MSRALAAYLATVGEGAFVPAFGRPPRVTLLYRRGKPCRLRRAALTGAYRIGSGKTRSDLDRGPAAITEKQRRYVCRRAYRRDHLKTDSRAVAEVARSKEAVRSLDVNGHANDLRRTVSFLRARTWHDFSSYERATVTRRVVRRMQVCRTDTFAADADYLLAILEEAKKLLSDLLILLRDLILVENEVSGHDGRYYVMRLRPYRTVENRIDGTVVTFVDITDRR